MKWDILVRSLGTLGVLALIAGPLTGQPSLAVVGVAIGVALIGYAYWLWHRHRHESPQWQNSRAVRSWFRRALR